MKEAKEQITTDGFDARTQAAEAQSVESHSPAASALATTPLMQRRAAEAGAVGAPTQLEAAEPAPNRTGLPDNLKSGLENLSGISMDDVRVHYNSPKPAQLQAHAYTQGTDIHIAPGQERHLPHEGWHVVQQAKGRVRPTMQMKGGVPVNDDAGLEREADMMGGRASFKEAKSTQSAMNLYGTSAKRRNEPHSVSTPRSQIIQRVINWGEAGGDEIRSELIKTKEVHELIKSMENSEKICNIKIVDAETEDQIYFARPEDDGKAINGEGSNVEVHIPSNDQGAMDKRNYGNKMLIKGEGEDAKGKQPPIVIALHELVHANEIMQGTARQKSHENEVIHSVYRGNPEDKELLKREVVPLEEVLTVGFVDSDNHFHEYHNLEGGDIKQNVMDNSRKMTENIYRKLIAKGEKLAYGLDGNVPLQMGERYYEDIMFSQVEGLTNKAKAMMTATEQMWTYIDGDHEGGLLKGEMVDERIRQETETQTIQKKKGETYTRHATMKDLSIVRDSMIEHAKIMYDGAARLQILIKGKYEEKRNRDLAPELEAMRNTKIREAMMKEEDDDDSGGDMVIGDLCYESGEE